MRKIILFIASSIDGYIARPSGEVDWLHTEGDYSYNDFTQTIDTILMGGRTYRQILDFGADWPYPTQKTYVFTRDVSRKSDEDVEFIHHDIIGFVKKLKSQKSSKSIWLVGGSEINTLLFEHKLIDELQLFIHPVFLGKGIPLFQNTIKETWVKTHDIEEFDNGLVKMVFQAKDQ